MPLLVLTPRQLRGLGLALTLTLGLWTWQASTHTGSRIVGLALTAVIVGGVLTSFGLPATVSRTRTRAAFCLLMACSVAVTALLPNGPGTAGVYFGAGRGSRLGPFGLVVTLVTEAAYLAALLLYQGGRPSSALVTNGIGIITIYVGSYLLGRLRQGQVESARAEERERLAREIHDVLAHTLTALSVQLEGARLMLEQRPGDPEALRIVERAQRLARQGLEETREAVGALRGDRLPGPDLLPTLVADFERDSGTPTRFETEGIPVRLSAEAQVALYRAAQEALTNIRKHAQAEQVNVRLRYVGRGAELVVEDAGATPNGSGPVDLKGTGGGYGLAGMRERAELAGGKLATEATPDGFRVTLWLPAA